jgi:hypothetical protein
MKLHHAHKIARRKVLVKNELESKVLEINVTCKERELNEHQELIMPPWAYTSL